MSTANTPESEAPSPVITELTEEQKAQFEPYVQKWQKLGASLDPVDLEPALAAVRKCYEAADLVCPNDFFVCDSPMQAAVAVAIMQDKQWPKISALADELYELSLILGEEPEAKVVRGKTFTKEFRAVEKLTGGDQLVAARKLFDTRQAEYDKLVDTISDKASDAFWKKVEDAMNAQNPGAHDAGWLAFYDYVRNVLGIRKETELAVGHIELAHHCGWWSAYNNCFILQHRPVECHKNEEGGLHCESGMAVRYRDSFGIYAIDGFRVDEQIVMRPESQTPADIDGETSADIRAIRLNRYPWERYLVDVKAKLMDDRNNEVEGTIEQLYELPNAERRLVYTCATGRIMTSMVPPQVSNCEEAQVWLGNGKKRNILGRT